MKIEQQIQRQFHHLPPQPRPINSRVNIPMQLAQPIHQNVHPIPYSSLLNSRQKQYSQQGVKHIQFVTPQKKLVQMSNHPIILPRQNSLSNFQRNMTYLPPQTNQKIRILDKNLEPIDINLNIIVNKDGKIQDYYANNHHKKNESNVQKQIVNESHQIPIQIHYDYTIDSPDVFCVICNTNYNDKDRQSHLQKHRKHFQENKQAYKPIKAIFQQPFMNKPLIKPIVQPQQFNVRYDPREIIITKNINYKNQQPIKKDFINDQSQYQKDLRINNKSIKMNNIIQRQSQKKQQQINKNEIKYTQVPKITQNVIQFTLLNESQMERQSVDIRDKSNMKRKIKNPQIQKKPLFQQTKQIPFNNNSRNQSIRLPRQSTYQQNANIQHEIIDPKRQSFINYNARQSNINNQRNDQNKSIRQSGVRQSAHNQSIRSQTFNQQPRISNQTKINQPNANQSSNRKSQVGEQFRSSKQPENSINQSRKSNISNQNNSQFNDPKFTNNYSFSEKQKKPQISFNQIIGQRQSNMTQKNAQLNQRNLSKQDNYQLSINQIDRQSNQGINNSRMSQVQGFNPNNNRISSNQQIKQIQDNPYLQPSNSAANFKKKKVKKNTLQSWE